MRVTKYDVQMHNIMKRIRDLNEIEPGVLSDFHRFFIPGNHAPHLYDLHYVTMRGFPKKEDEKRLFKRMSQRYVPMLPETWAQMIPQSAMDENAPCIGPNKWLPVVDLSDFKSQGKVYFMPFAFNYLRIMRKRRKNCVKACVLLLRVAPFKQKDLRRWWVREMVLKTWQNEIWK